MEHRWEKKRNERGQSLLEFALLVPILLIILAGVLDVGRLYFAYVAVTDAAAEGAAYAAVCSPNCTDGDIRARAKAASGGLVQVVEDDQVVIERPTIASGAPVTVTVTYEFALATPFINLIVPGGVLPLNAVATEVILGGISE